LLRRGISLSFRQRGCFCFDEDSRCHSDREVFLLRRGISLSFRQAKILQSLKSSFRMTVAFCHSDREVFYFDEESRCRSDTQRFFRHAKLFQNDSGLLSFRQRSFLLRRGISLLFRQRKDSSVAKSSFRMTVAYCHSDAKRNFFVTVCDSKSFKV
jgi:hypothetical protein